MLDTCKCQDCNGNICGKEMTQEEIDQDGMCEICAGHVWNEMTATGDEYIWTHTENT